MAIYSVFFSVLGHNALLLGKLKETLTRQKTSCLHNTPFPDVTYSFVEKETQKQTSTKLRSVGRSVVVLSVSRSVYLFVEIGSLLSFTYERLRDLIIQFFSYSLCLPRWRMDKKKWFFFWLVLMNVTKWAPKKRRWKGEVICCFVLLVLIFLKGVMNSVHMLFLLRKGSYLATYFSNIST